MAPQEGGRVSLFFPRWVRACLLVWLVWTLPQGAVQAALTTYNSNQTLTGLSFTGGTSFSISAGVITVNGSIVGGDGGTLSISNATVTQGGNSTYHFGAGYNANSTTGYINVGNGGVLNIGNGGARTFIGGGNSGSATGIGVLTLSGSGVVNIGAPGSFPNESVYFSGYGGSGTVYLNGGTLSTARTLTSGVGSNAFLYFNGGTLKVSSSFSQNGSLIGSGFGTAWIQGSGAFVNTNGINVTIDESLLEDSSSTGGAFTKLG